MPEASPIYGATSAELVTFPEPMRAALGLIQAQPGGDASRALLSFVAAFVHPDFVCNLADFAHFDNDVKQAALDVFEFALTQGMTLEEQGAVLRWITPFLTGNGSLPPAH